MEDLKIDGIQIGLFFNKRVDRPNEYVDGLNLKCNRLFDQIPMILPLPENAPGEIPIVTMNSSNNKYTASIGRERVDLVLKIDEKYRVDFIKQSEAIINNFIRFFIEDRNILIKRVAVIVNYFYPSLEGINFSKLVNERIVDIHGGTPFFAQSIYTSQETLGTLKINNYTLIGKAKSGPIEGILIRRDINTNDEQNYSSKLNPEECITFVKKSIELHKIQDFIKIL